MTQKEKDKITAEIERLMKWKPKAFPCGMRQRDIINIRKTALLSLKNFINSLQVEQPNEDVEKFIQNLIDEYPINKDCVPEQSLNDYYQGLRFGVLQGTQWQKEQMIKNCLYNTEVMLCTKQDNKEYLTLANDKLPHIPVSFGLNVGDKVKIIIIKEDEQ